MWTDLGFDFSRMQHCQSLCQQSPHRYFTLAIYPYVSITLYNHISVLSRLRVCWPPPPPVLSQFLWMMRNVPNRMKNQFFYFYFFSYSRFCSQFLSVYTLITIKFFKSGQISWKVRNELKRVKNQSSDFWNF